jgi:hypothetical protein
VAPVVMGRFHRAVDSRKRTRCANYSAGNRLPHMPCRSLEYVHVICLFHWQARARLETGGGWRRTRVRRERRWPSFIIWRWVGPALAGWIRCRWRIPPLRLPPREPHLTTNSLSLQLLLGPLPLGESVRRRRPPGRQLRGERRRLPGKAPGRQPGVGPGRALGNRPRRARVRAPSAADRPPGNVPRRVAGVAKHR